MKDDELENTLTLLDKLQSSCTGCGLCSEACATYQSAGWEHESPRGRLQLAAQLLHGRIHPQSSALETFDRCLGCRACEPLCPCKVPYRQVRQIVQELRRNFQSETSETAPDLSNYKRWIVLAQRVGSLLWRHYGWKWFSQPYPKDQIPSGSFLKKNGRHHNKGPMLAVCCVQDLLQHEVIAQTMQFMERLGSPLTIDSKQPCCGAVYERLIHGGAESIAFPSEHQKAAALQQKTTASFKRWMTSTTCFLSKGCQCYVAGHASEGFDLYAWIETLLKEKGVQLSFDEPREVYYQPYCGQSERDALDPIWRILKGIKNLSIRDLPNPRTCCGGYCGESLLHPQQAEKLCDQKIEGLPEYALVIVTSADCWGQFKIHASSKKITLLYPIQLIAEAQFFQ